MNRTVLCCLCCLLLSAWAWSQERQGKSYADPVYGYVLDYPADWQLETDSGGGFAVSSQTDKASLPNEFWVQVDSLSESLRNLDFMEYMEQNKTQLRRELEAQGHRGVRIFSSQAEELNSLTVHRLVLISNQYGGLLLRTQYVRIRRGGWHYTLVCQGEDGYYFDLAAPDFERMISSFRFPARLPDYLLDYVRVRADLGGRDTVWHWQGMAYALVPGEKRRELFALEGYHIVRAQPAADGYLLLGREVALFLDPRTGQLAESWRHPVTGKDIPVVHIFNDPFNQDLRFAETDHPLLPMILPSQDLGDQIAWHSEIFPYYPNPLQRRDYPLNSQNNTFQAVEFSQYLARKDNLASTALQSVPASYSFTRIYPWLPFMEMGERPGQVLLNGRGYKLEQGFAGLPHYLRDYVSQHHPEFALAPETYVQPNETAWSYYKRLMETIRSTTQDVPEP